MFESNTPVIDKWRESFLSDRTLFEAWLFQIQKDTGIAVQSNNEGIVPDIHAVGSQVSANIKTWIRSDREHLRHVLYRTDVSETKLTRWFAEVPDAEESQVLSILILERCFQKVLFRKLFSQT